MMKRRKKQKCYVKLKSQEVRKYEKMKNQRRNEIIKNKKVGTIKNINMYLAGRMKGGVEI
jgi:hypothetical protein